MLTHGVDVERLDPISQETVLIRLLQIGICNYGMPSVGLRCEDGGIEYSQIYRFNAGKCQ